MGDHSESLVEVKNIHNKKASTLPEKEGVGVGKPGHTQMGRFALRHQIYDPSPSETRPFCHHCKEEGHLTEDCVQASEVPGRETTTEYPSQDYRQLDELLEERRHLREQTPRRDLDKKKYQPRRLIEQGKIELGLPRTACTPHRDPISHEIYPIPEDEEERGSNNQQRTPGQQ